MLTDKQRRTIISIITNGSSRRVAARYARCAPSTITRLVARDPEFSRQLAVAEKSVEIDALRSIRAASKTERYWRAAAWLLERTNPEDFAARPPTLFTGEQVFEVISQIAEYLFEAVPEENYQRAMQRLEELIEQCRDEQTTPQLPKPKPKPNPKPNPHCPDPEYSDFSDPYEPTVDFCCYYPEECPQPYDSCQYYPDLCPYYASIEAADKSNPPVSPESPTQKMQHPSIAHTKDMISPPIVTPNNQNASNSQQ
jgi:hypothetical protein